MQNNMNVWQDNYGFAGKIQDSGTSNQLDDQQGKE